MACRECIPLPCANPPDLASGIDGALYSALDYSFIVDCPDNCYCPPGLFPQTISILASTIPPVIPPINQPGDQIILELQGCISLITRTLDPGSTQAQIIATAQSMQAEWAGQQALCNALLVPGVNCNTGSGFIDVCNDAQTFCCPGFGPVTVAAGLFCEKLNITGLNQGQIDDATALLKANLNQQAIDSDCPGFKTFCSIVESNGAAGGDITIVVHNLSATLNFDSSSFQLCASNGVPYANSVQPNVAPLGVVQVISVVGPPTINPFKIRYQGYVIFTDPNANSGFARQVDIFAHCGFPPAC